MKEILLEGEVLRTKKADSIKMNEPTLNIMHLTPPYQMFRIYSAKIYSRFRIQHFYVALLEFDGAD